MEDGSITWDDEDHDHNTNKNEINGYLPDGQYDVNTRIYYCCQNQGYWYNPVELPVDRPFYLLPYSRNCQRVKWALSTLEYIIYDTEDDQNGDQFDGTHVFTNQVKSLPKIYYCYYKGRFYVIFGLRFLISVTIHHIFT